MDDDPDMQPEPLLDWLQLACRGGVQFLMHHGVGVQVPVGPASSPCQVQFAMDGDALLRHGGGERQWVDELLPKRLFRCLESNRLCITDMQGASVWLHEVSSRFDIRCFRHEYKMHNFVGEAYIFHLPRAGAYVWWALNSFRDLGPLHRRRLEGSRRAVRIVGVALLSGAGGKGRRPPLLVRVCELVAAPSSGELLRPPVIGLIPHLNVGRDRVAGGPLEA